MNSKRLGMLIVVISLLTLGLLISFKVQFDRQRVQACAESCSLSESTSGSCTLQSCPFHQKNNWDWIPLFASILVAGLGGIGLYLSLAQDGKVITEKDYDLTSLSEEEKKAFLSIKENKEGIFQRELGIKLNLSKVKVTRLLDGLEQKGFIERKRRGMSNLIVLK